MDEVIEERWQEWSEEILSRMKERRQTCQKALFREIEQVATFAGLTEGAIRWRSLRQAQVVDIVTDGADWLQGLLERHRPGAVQGGDVPPVAEYVSAVSRRPRRQRMPACGWCRPEAASVHISGTPPVFHLRQTLPPSVREQEAIREPLGSVCIHKHLMLSPREQQGAHWFRDAPERQHTRHANAPQATGMQEAPAHVHPMLALCLASATIGRGKFTRMILAFVAEMEREKIMDRTMTGRVSMARQGAFKEGPKPLYGYKWHDEQKKDYRVIDEFQADVCRWIHEQFDKGKGPRALLREVVEKDPNRK